MSQEQKISRNTLIGGLLVIFAMVIFGSFGLLVRFIQADAILLVWAMQVVGAVCFFIYISKNRALFNHHGMIRSIFLMTIFATIADLSFFIALRSTTVSTAVFLKFLMPIFVVLFTLRSSKVPIKKLLLLLVLGTVGVFLALSSQGNISLTINTGNLLAIVTAVSLAMFIIFLKKIADVVPLSTILFYRYAIASIIVLPFIIRINNIIYQINEWWLWLAGFGLLYAVMATFIHVQGLKLTKVQYGAILGYIEPVAATVMSIIFLGEMLTPLLVIGGTLILLGSALALQ